MKRRRKQYRVSLILDGGDPEQGGCVIDAGTTDNCRHALHGAYQSLCGIPSAECNVRADGDQFCYLRTNWRGEIVEIEFSQPARNISGVPYRVVACVNLNPQWRGWPRFAATANGTDPIARRT